MEFDYEKLMNIAFMTMDADNLAKFASNEEVPLEYCDRILKRKGINWKVKAAVAGRSDCTDKMLEKLCNRPGEKFTNKFLLDNSDRYFPNRSIPRNPIGIDRLIDGAVGKDGRVNTDIISYLSNYWRLNEEQRKRVAELVFKEDWYYKEQLDFVKNQLEIPKDKIGWFKNKLYAKNAYEYNMNTADYHFKALEIPFNEEDIDTEFGTQCHHTLDVLRQIAYNPSISDYVILQLHVRYDSNDKWFDEINEVLEMGRERREEYRKSHGWKK